MEQVLLQICTKYAKLALIVPLAFIITACSDL